MKYQQLTPEKRYQISALIKAEQKEVAIKIGVHPSTISRELKRNRDVVRGYHPNLAEINKAHTEHKKKKRFFLTKPIESIMPPFFKTSKTRFLIPPYYNT